MINYTPSGLQRLFTLILFSVLISYSASAQCIIGNDQGGFDPENDFFWGQSFTAECDGTIAYVEWLTGGPGTQNAGVLEFFEGETVSGTSIYTQNYSAATFTAANESFRITFDDPITVVAGNKYTFETQIFSDMLISTSNPYAGGIAYENGSGFAQVDFVFNVSITDALSLDDNTLDATLSFYPNPAKDILSIDLGKQHNDVYVTTYNILGDVVLKQQVPVTNRVVSNIQELPAGIYLVRLETENDDTLFRFMKK